VTERGLTTSWEWEGCPNVSAGPDSPVGHGGPQAQYHLTPSTLLHIDFGIRENDYCSDLQRVWYVRRDEEDSPPPELRQAFQSAREALMAGFAALQPGVQGWEVDAVARRTLVEAGYPEYQHAFGHHLGRAAHDGATVLGPRWARYGQTPYGLVEAGNVFAIELGVAVPGMGYVGLEENVLVSERGPEWLSDPQTDLWLI
jgi:Xaa-Pro aminopeptidase